MKFRPCIDLREGRVVQIVGSSLRDDDPAAAHTNFVSSQPASYYAALYRRDGLDGGHVIQLGPGNRDAALDALRAFPGGLHVGGGITPDNAGPYLDAGASHVIVTSYVFSGGRVNTDRLLHMESAVGRDRLVLDLSCRQRDEAYWVVTDRWQRFTDLGVTAETLQSLSRHCAEFLVHGVDVEGKRQGIEDALVALLGQHCPIPVTYAGGVRGMDDLEHVKTVGRGCVDVTVGSALDLFGGTIAYTDVLAWHRANHAPGA